MDFIYIVNGLYLCSSANYTLNLWNIFCIVWVLTYFSSESPMGNFWLFWECQMDKNLSISLISTLVSDQESQPLKALCFPENRSDIWCVWYLETKAETLHLRVFVELCSQCYPCDRQHSYSGVIGERNEKHKEKSL